MHDMTLYRPGPAWLRAIDGLAGASA
jgi:hypothetical protein